MTNGIGGTTSQGNPVRVLDKDRNLTDAIRIAGQSEGSDVVVGYVDAAKGGADGPIQYAVLDGRDVLKTGDGIKGAKATFDPANLSFGDGTTIVSAVIVTDKSDGKIDRNYLGQMQFFDVDPDIQAETVLALAQAASTRIEGPNPNKQVEGFHFAKTDTTWVTMVHQNRATVLKQVSATLAALETAITDKTAALKSAVAEGRLGDAEALNDELAALAGQRDELTTYQGIIRVDLLTDPKGSGYVPGMQDKQGKPVTAGAWRSSAGGEQAVNVLVEQRAMLQGQMQATSDPERLGRLERQISALDGAIRGVGFKTADFVRSQGLIDNRVAALGSMCRDVSAANKDLKDLQKSLKEQTSPNATAFASQANDIRERLIKDFKAQLVAYKANGGAPKAVAFLNSQIDELKILKFSNSGDPKKASAEYVNAMLGKINQLQKGLLPEILAMAESFKGATPEEARKMRLIAEGVEDFSSAYTTLQSAAELHKSFTKKLGSTAGAQGFKLPQSSIDGLSAALKWDPIKGGRDPFQTNQYVVGQYVETSREIRAYVGIDVPDWYSVGAKACNQVGGEVAKIMTIETCLATFGLVDGTAANDIRAAKAILAVIDGPTLDQGMAVAGALGSDFVNALRKAVSSMSLGPLEAFTDKLPSITEAVKDLRQGFVDGNVKIAQNVLTARKVFFEAEFAGEDGVAALQKYAKTNPGFDPENYMTDAYRCIQQAKAKVEAGDKGMAGKLMLKANALIAMQEQSTFLQTTTTFGNRTMRLVLDNAGSASSLKLEKADGSGKTDYQLVDDWTKLHVRMGMTYVDKGAYDRNVRSSADGPLYFKLTIKPNQRLEVEPGMKLAPGQTFQDEQGKTCVKPGVTLYMALPPNAPEGTAGRLFIEASKGGAIGASMMVRPEAPSGPSYHYDAGDNMMRLAGDVLAKGIDALTASAKEVFEGSDDDKVAKKPQSLAVNGAR
jgi:hypothetical protein